jgi:hypothetical protein
MLEGVNSNFRYLKKRNIKKTINKTLKIPNRLMYSVKRIFVKGSIKGRININKRTDNSGLIAKNKTTNSNEESPIFIDRENGADKNKPKILIINKLKVIYKLFNLFIFLDRYINVIPYK